jgi:phage terminase large subunit GpA-like protein
MPVPACGEFVEILWSMIRWDEGKPETAKFCCPACGTFSDERHKFEMVAKGRWRVTRPDVLDHAGFRLNALVSPLAKASWAKLAAEFIAAKDNPTDLQVFINCSLAEGWSEGGADIDDAALISRAKPFSIDAVPVEVLLITCGVDVQDDRLEATIAGWDRKGHMFILDHRVLWGSPGENHVWRELSDLLDMRFQHPHGGRIGVSATIIDSGDGDWTQAVYNFAFPRASRHVMAGKGVGGSRPIIEASKGKIQGGGRLWVLGIDGIKTELFDRLQRDQGIYFSKTLAPVFYEQLCAERRIVKYCKGRPIRRFEVISGRRNEALDCVVMARAARQALRPNFDAIDERLHGREPVRQSIAEQLAR